MRLVQGGIRPWGGNSSSSNTFMFMTSVRLKGISCVCLFSQSIFLSSVLVCLRHTHLIKYWVNANSLYSVSLPFFYRPRCPLSQFSATEHSFKHILYMHNQIALSSSKKSTENALCLFKLIFLVRCYYISYLAQCNSKLLSESYSKRHRVLQCMLLLLLPRPGK